MNSSKIKLVFKILLYVILAFVCNQIVQQIFPGLDIYPDFFFVLIWTFSYFHKIEWSLLLAVISGLFRDILFGQVFGLSIILGILGAYLASHLLQFVWQQRIRFLPVQVLLVSLIIKFLETISLNIVTMFKFSETFLLNQVFISYRYQIPSYIGLNFIATVICYILINHVFPFEKMEKDVYAEDMLNLNGEF